MKVYVDKLPKKCEECPMCRSGKLKLQRKGRYVEAEQCVFGQYKYQTIDDEINTCPLHSLADHDKQVRKEVCKEIKEIIESDAVKYLDFDRDEFALDYQEFKDILNEIEQGETK